MSEGPEPDRLEELETRNAHQELALETLTRSLIELEKTVAAQAQQLRRLEAQVRGLHNEPGDGAPPDERPPHY